MTGSCFRKGSDIVFHYDSCNKWYNSKQQITILTIFFSFLIDIKPRSLLLLAFRSYLRHIGACSVTISVAFQIISRLPVERDLHSKRNWSLANLKKKKRKKIRGETKGKNFPQDKKEIIYFLFYSPNFVYEIFFPRQTYTQLSSICRLAI